MTTATTLPDSVWGGTALRHGLAELGQMLGREVACTESRVERECTRPAGESQVHISFRLALQSQAGESRYGALLVPLPEAITLAGLYLMWPDAEIDSCSEAAVPDEFQKDAMLELGNVLAGALGAALAELGMTGWNVLAAGCQGVRADVRPAFPYEEGTGLVVVRFRVRVEPRGPFDAIWILPAFD